MSPTSTLVLIAGLISVAHSFILYLPQSYASEDQPYLGEIGAYNYLARQLPIEMPSEVVAEAPESLEKRSEVKGTGPVRRRSAETFRCPCIHKVCTYHCMSGKRK